MHVNSIDRRHGRWVWRAAVTTCVLILFCLNVSCRTSEPVSVRLEVTDEMQAETLKTTAPGFSDDEFSQHVARLREKVPEGFTIAVQKPFVVIGNESPEYVKRRAEKTIKWAVDLLKKDFFQYNPQDIIDIWLFKDKSTYNKYARELFNDTPSTPYGYFLESDKALLMNISTGGGTLVHEIVHPFIRANFPACPPWFDEGLASLYEQCGEKNGHIYGYTNWRLEGLQGAVRQGSVPSFKQLMAAGSDDFYLTDRGTNYGQARYLCYYLQERGLLVTFYHEFHRRRHDDPTGYETLKKVLNIRDMDAFKQTWEQFVLSLTFP